MNKEQFKVHRKSLDLSQQAIAHMIGLSTRQVMRYENGQSEIPGPVSILIDIMVTRRLPKNFKARRKTKPKNKTYSF